MWLFKTILASLYGMAFLFTVTAILLVAPYIETKYFPVVSKMRIDQIIYDGPNRTIIYASFTKRRDCDYIGMAWFHGKRATGFTRAALQLMRDPSDISSSPNRPLGRQSSGPWIVGIPFGDIRDNSFVELYHHCTPLWITTTEFYP